MKTKKEIDDLKANWKSDPCWDIEDTEGFEEYHDELLKWRNEREEKWELEEGERLMKKATELGCSIELVKYIEFLEFRLNNVAQERGS